MGREIRRVPANWEHPRYTEQTAPYNPLRSRVGELVPMHDDYDAALESFASDIKTKGLKEAISYWGGCPTEETYIDYQGAERPWYQIYETVSEGTPVTPAFATREELVDYLCANGDFWDQKRRMDGGRALMNCDPWARDVATKFVFGSGWAPSMVIAGGQIMSGVEAMAKLAPAT